MRRLKDWSRTQWRIQGGKGGASVPPPFGLHPTLRSTDDELSGTPLSGYTTKKIAAMAYLRMHALEENISMDR